MAYNPNIPAPTNRVQDDIAAMRGNFQHLAPLAQLAPVAGELQAVSGLAPYVQAILGSRIVEMGSNANGQYVRWENGLQVCWHVLQSTSIASPVLSTSWTFPASFASTPVVLNFARLTPGSYRYAGSATPHLHFGFVSHTTISNSSVILAIYRTADAPGFQSGDYVTFSPIAIGRWK